MAIGRLILLGGVVTVLACGGDDGGDGGTGPPGGPDENEVQVSNNQFNPATLTVDDGTTVSWVWVSNGTTHNVTFDDGEESGDQSSGTYTRSFTEPGDYPYHCTIHGSPTSGMRGTVEVAAAGSGNGAGGGGGDGGGGGGYPDGY